MRIGIPHLCLAALVAALALVGGANAADENAAIPPVNQRYVPADVSESPSFQRHVSPLFGRLGCNGRSCHGSFQGRGDFRLSLFGYDFKADHDELLKGEPQRANAEKPLESLILVKPTDADMHEGGLRYKKGGWEYNVFRRWLEAGAKYSDKDVQKLVTLEVTPAEIQFAAAGQTVQLKAVAVWPDGTREDVTCLCRYTTNSEQVAKINPDGQVTATDLGDTHVVVSYDNAVIAVPVIRPVTNLAGANYPKVPTPTKVDELVVEKLRKLGVVQSDLCTDAEFLRRVSLDLTGTLPTATEVEQFLADKASTKRADKIEQLLTTPAYVAWWATKLNDYTGNNDTKLNNVTIGRNTASQFWYDWIYDRVAKNEPYDKLAEGVVVAGSRAPGESYADYCQSLSKITRKDDDASFADRPSMPYYWARNNFRTTEERAIGFAYTFLGIRIQCAQCHKHPFDQWAKSDFDAFEPFFSRVVLNQNAPRDKDSLKEYEAIMAKLDVDTTLRNNELRNALGAKLAKGETVPFPEIAATPPGQGGRQRQTEDTSRPVPPNSARVLGGEPTDLNKFADARTPLMDWLRSKDNPYFAKAFVNRVWASYFNVGIVNPPDDMSLANPPSNRALLDHLAQGFIASNFDMKWVHREILGSRTYQLSWQPNETNAKDEKNFARSVPRRLAAEVAVDALAMAVSSDEKAATYLTNLTGRATFLAGSSARPAQGGNGTMNGFALQVFGRSIRESNCDCDRSADASLLQTVYLQNDTSVLSAIEGGRGSWIEQVSKQEQTRTSDGGRVAPEDVAKEISRMKARLDRAKEKKDKQQVKDIEARIAELEKAAKNNKEVAAAPAGINLEPSALVRQAYLRTVSRLPTPDEMARCTQFLAEAESPAAGAKGLLWTLINTKEFIVNH